MHRAIVVIFAFLSLVACAFKSEKWLAERGDDSDMLRLRAAYSDCLSKVDSPAENVTIPLEYHADGTIKSRLVARRAQLFLDTDFIWGEGIHVAQYREDGSAVGTIEAENCVVDRRTRTGWVEGFAKMTYGGSTVQGRGVYFSLDREFIKIFAQSEIRTKGLNDSPEKFLK